MDKAETNRNNLNTPVPSVAGVSATPVEANGIAWNPTVSSATRKRRVFALTQMAGVAGASALAMVGAYLMQHSWPASIGQVRDTPLEMIPIVGGIVRTVISPEFRRFVPLFVLSPIVYVIVFQWFSFFYQRSGPISPYRDTGKIFKATATGIILLYLAGTAYGIYDAKSGYKTVLFFAYAGTLVFWGVLLFRSGALCILFLVRSMGIGHTRVAFIAREEPKALREEFGKTGSEHTVAGVVTIGDVNEGAFLTRPLGSLEQLEQIINRNYLDEVVLAVDPGELTMEQRLNLAHTCWRLGADLKMVTPFHPYFHTSVQPELIGDLPLLRVQRAGLYTTRSQVIKRSIDLLGSAAGLALLSPVLLLTALLIKLESKGPVFFIQERPGLHGRVFRIFKFRSMHHGSDTAAHREAQRKLIQEGKPSGYDAEGKPIYGKVASDARVTRVGRFIRKTSIDELPQLINVLWGEMSLVGPRPAVLADVEDFKDWHFRRHNIRPGLTGLWQVSGRSRLSFDEMVELDIKYIEEWSLMLDLRILLRTIPALLKVDRAF
jgi:exopolysaccharide biosynthesis polyprenyl glycosylphosphotransferase